jgi:hypothetical protein
MLTEKMDENGAANYFIHTTAIDKFFSVTSKEAFSCEVLSFLV